MTLVLLHALPFGASMWPTDLLERAVAPTLYGFGESIEAWAAAVVDLIGPGRHVVVGNSIGGSCAIEVARLAPERIEHLVLVGAKAGHRPEPEFRDTALAVLERDGLNVAYERYWQPLFGPSTSAATLDSARAIVRGISVDDIARGVRVFHARADRAEFLAGWSGPITVVAGDRDRSPAGSREFAASLLDATYVEVPDCGHYVPLEHPDALRRLL